MSRLLTTCTCECNGHTISFAFLPIWRCNTSCHRRDPARRVRSGRHRAECQSESRPATPLAARRHVDSAPLGPVLYRTRHPSLHQCNDMHPQWIALDILCACPFFARNVYPPPDAPSRAPPAHLSALLTPAPQKENSQREITPRALPFLVSGTCTCTCCACRGRGVPLPVLAKLGRPPWALVLGLRTSARPPATNRQSWMGERRGEGASEGG